MPGSFWASSSMVSGGAAITKAALGTSPISSVPYVLSLRFPFSLGQFTFIFNMFLILGQWLLLKKDFKPFQFLQIGVTSVSYTHLDVYKRQPQ